MYMWIVENLYKFVGFTFMNTHTHIYIVGIL